MIRNIRKPGYQQSALEQRTNMAIAKLGGIAAHQTCQLLNRQEPISAQIEQN